MGDDAYDTEPCLTNPDVLEIVTEAVLAELKPHPRRENISVSQNDNDQYCRCAKCAALDEREGTPMGSLLTFVNAVADEVAKQYPQVKVGHAELLVLAQAARDAQAATQRADPALQHRVLPAPPDQRPRVPEERRVLPGHGRLGQDLR